jgi:hypothetical protein
MKNQTEMLEETRDNGHSESKMEHTQGNSIEDILSDVSDLEPSTSLNSTQQTHGFSIAESSEYARDYDSLEELEPYFSPVSDHELEHVDYGSDKESRPNVERSITTPNDELRDSAELPRICTPSYLR